MTSFPKECVGPKVPGLNTFCYQEGLDQAMAKEPTPIKNRIFSGVCQHTKPASTCFTKGLLHGMGVTESKSINKSTNVTTSTCHAPRIQAQQADWQPAFRPSTTI